MRVRNDTTSPLTHISVERSGPKRAHGRDGNAVRCRKLYKDPWLLATSLQHSRGAGKRIVRLYALRMQIEETFRDLKNGRWGLGLEYARSRSHARLENLLLVTDPNQIPFEVANIVADVQATNFPERAEAIADRVARHVPDVISLQEVSSFWTQSPGDFLIGNLTPATTPMLDYL